MTMLLVSLCKTLLKVQGMALVLTTSGLLLGGCGGGSQSSGSTEPPVQTDGGDGSGTQTGTTDPTPTPTPEQHSLSLTSQPSNAVIYEGQNQTFSLAYSNSHPVSVSWYRNGSPISGASGNSYTVANATTGSAGTYSCAVTDGTLTVNCASFSLTVNQIVRITQQPTNQMVNEGVNVSFSVAATGTGPVSYQWYFNDQPLTGKTAAQLSLTDTTSVNGGQYHVRVSNGGSSANSSKATLTVISNPNGIVQLSWNAPTKRADGSTLASSDIASYQVFHGDSATGALAQLTTVTGAELSLQVEELAKGTHYFALTTVDTQGLVSAQSSRIAVAVQ